MHIENVSLATKLYQDLQSYKYCLEKLNEYKKNKQMVTSIVIEHKSGSDSTINIFAPPVRITMGYSDNIEIQKILIDFYTRNIQECENKLSELGVSF